MLALEMSLKSQESSLEFHVAKQRLVKHLAYPNFFQEEIETRFSGKRKFMQCMERSLNENKNPFAQLKVVGKWYNFSLH